MSEAVPRYIPMRAIKDEFPEHTAALEEIERLRGVLATVITERDSLQAWVHRVTDSARERDSMRVRIGEVKAALAASEQAQRDANLRADNVEISLQQELQRIQSLAILLEALPFWPSPTADQNLARDIGRVLQGKAAERSTGLEDFPAPMVYSWKQRVEMAEQAKLQAEQERDQALAALVLVLQGAHFRPLPFGPWFQGALETLGVQETST